MQTNQLTRARLAPVRSRLAPVRLSQRGSDALDGLRAAAAVLVVLHHVRIWLFAPPAEVAHWTLPSRVFYRVTSLGAEYVLIFFVLSGFFIGGAVARKVADGRFRWHDYLLDRATRLYIVLLPALVLTVVLDAIGAAVAGSHSIYGGQGSYALAPLNIGGAHTGFVAFVGNLAFLQDLRYVTTFGSNLPLWSLAFEFWFYLAFPAMVALLLPRTSRRGRVVAGGVALVSLLLLRANPLFFAIWLVGVAVAFLPTRPVRIKPEWARGLAVAAFGFLVAILGFWVGKGGQRTSEVAIGLATALVIFAFSHAYTGARVEGRAAFGPYASRLAKSSFTLYLVHAPILLLLSATTIHRHEQLWQPTAGRILAGALLTALIVGLAEVISWGTERRTGAVRAWLGTKTGTRPHS
jgi:peptidoglycan/LPS O-acetylase OafA/YrhL